MPRLSDDPEGQEKRGAGPAGDVLSWLARAGGTVLEKLVFVAGYATAMACTHRDPPMSPGTPPRDVYTNAGCGIEGGPERCSPSKCPLATQAVGAVSSAGIQSFISRRGWEARSDGSGSDDPEQGRSGG